MPGSPGDFLRSAGARHSRWLLLGALVTAALLLFAVARELRSRAVGQSTELRVTLSPIPGLSVAARVTVFAPGAAAVVLRHGPDRAYAGGSRRIALPPTGAISTTLVGLRPGATAHVEVTAHDETGPIASSGDRAVTLPPLEPGVPGELPVVVNTGTSTDPVMLAMNGKGGIGSFAVIADRSGRVLWYRRCGGGPFAFDQLPNGRFVVHDPATQSFEELELDGRIARRWTHPKSLTGADSHDFQLLSNGNALLFGAETHEVDTREIFPGGVARALRWDDTVSEVTPSGSVLWSWSSFGRFSEDEITEDAREPVKPEDYEVVHMNSIDPGADGRVRLSLRNVSSVVEIKPRTGAIVWRLGGKRSDFRIVGDPLSGFHRQHDARLVAPDRILLFDNGNFHDPPESRVVEYRLDEEARTATLVWQHRRSPPVFIPVSGSVQRLPSGNTLISWGPLGIVSEVDRNGGIAWEMRAPAFGIYRARAVEGGAAMIQGRGSAREQFR